VDRPVVGGFRPGLEQAVHLRQVRDAGPVADLDQELVPHSPEKTFDFTPSFWLTGQSRLILWITSGRGGRRLPGFAAGAFETADGFLVAADFGGEGFEALAELVDLDGETGQGGGVVAAGAVFRDDSAQVGPPVEGGPADAGAGGYFGEGDGLPGRGEFGAGGLDPGQLVGVSWHRPG
jgi:hypothetical protein